MRALCGSVGYKVIMKNFNDIVAVYQDELRKGDILDKPDFNNLELFSQKIYTNIIQVRMKS